MDELDAERILDVARLNVDGIALSRAVTRCDFDDARSYAGRIVARAGDRGFVAIAQAAADVQDRLGHSGDRIRQGLGAALLTLASSMDLRDD